MIRAVIGIAMGLVVIGVGLAILMVLWLILGVPLVAAVVGAFSAH